MAFLAELTFEKSAFLKSFLLKNNRFSLNLHLK